MDIKELEIQLKEAETNNDHEKSLEILEKINELIKKELEEEKENKRILEKGLKINYIRQLETKLKMNPTKNEELYLRGKLIKELKEYKKIALPREENDIRYKIDEEVAKHKEVCKDIKVSNKGKIKISERLGLTIKSISDTIHLFLSKHDVINKAKRILSSAVIGGAISIGADILIKVLLGSGISVSGLIGGLPIIAYIGISSIVRNILNKTSYQNYQYKHSEEYQELIKKIPEEYKEEYEEIRNLLKEKENVNGIERTAINKKLIELYSKIKDSTKVDELARIFKLEKHDLLLENKKIYEETIDKCLNDKIELTKKEYQTLVKENLKNDIKIFESENAIKEAVKDGTKKMGIDLVTLAVARTIASFAIPGYKVTSISDLIVPLVYMTSNNIIGMIKYNGKIKNTNYKGKKVKINNKEKFEEVAKMKNQQLAMAAA